MEFSFIGSNVMITALPVRKADMDVVSEERASERSERLRRFMVEAFAMNTFCLVINVPNELLVAHMALGTMLRTRALAVVTNTITGRPYGVWRDAVVVRVTGDHSTPVKRYVGDTIAFLFFQLPLYWINMTFGGHATLRQMASASILVTLLAGLAGRPYGVYLDFVRRLASRFLP